MDKINLVPKRRFREFQDMDDWEYCKLEEKFEFFSGLTYSPKDIRRSGSFVIRSLNVKNGEIVDADNVFVEKKVAKSKNVEVGDIIVVVRNGSRSLIGKHAQIKTEMLDTVIGAFMTGISYKVPRFGNALLGTQNFDKEIAKNLGATINQITTGMFKQMGFHFPKKESEQIRIGEFFDNLDNIIFKHQRQLEKLKSLKTAYLSEMFPAEGEKQPNRRFKGFTDDWELRKLGELADIVGGGTPSTAISDYWNGNIDWYSPAEIGEQIYVFGSQKKITQLGLEKSSAKIHPIGTILFTSRAGIGNTAILAKEGATNQGFQSILSKKDVLDSYFIFSRTNELKRYGEQTGAGSTFVEVSGKQMAQMPIYVPKIEEQQKIGAFFKQLDDTIALHQHKLEKLQNLKKAYLNEMFV